MCLRASNILLSILLLLMWCAILFATFILAIISDIFHHFGDGVLKYLFLIIYISAVILSIVFRKKFRRFCSSPVILIVATIISVIVNSFIYLGIKSYISDFSPEKWDSNEKLRIYMIDDFEYEHQIIGISEKEVIDLLGNPTNISGNEEYCYEYYVGDSIIDSYTYNIIFDAGIVKETRIIEH